MLLPKPTSMQLESRTLSGSNSISGKPLVWGLFIVMFFLHQDFWWWENMNLVFGFIPMGLAYHGLFSIACAVLGWLAIRYAWPVHLEKFADEDSEKTEDF